MDIIVINNGLGNQMSQYALYLSKRAINKKTYFIYDRRSKQAHNGFELQKVFNINYTEGVFERFLNLLLRILSIRKYSVFTKPLIKVLNFLGIRLINENYDYNFNPQILIPSKGLNFYYGGWHSQKYFLNVEEEVRRSFRFSLEKPSQELERIIEKIKSTNSVSIHVRKGDFLTGINYNMFGAVCTEIYFERAIVEIEKYISNPFFYVFTNDVEWAKEKFKADNFEIVSCNSGADSWKDMYLISICKQCINSNSSFSWWGAWLNTNNHKRVIVPPFFLNNIIDKDVYLPEWIRISNH